MSKDFELILKNMLFALQVCLSVWQFTMLTPVGPLIQVVVSWLLRPFGLSETYSTLEELHGRVFKEANCFVLQPEIPSARRRGVDLGSEQILYVRYLGKDLDLERKASDLRNPSDLNMLLVNNKMCYYIIPAVWEKLQALQKVTGPVADVGAAFIATVAAEAGIKHVTAAAANAVDPDVAEAALFAAERRRTEQRLRRRRAPAHASAFPANASAAAHRFADNAVDPAVAEAALFAAEAGSATPAPAPAPAPANAVDPAVAEAALFAAEAAPATAPGPANAVDPAVAEAALFAGEAGTGTPAHASASAPHASADAAHAAYVERLVRRFGAAIVAPRTGSVVLKGHREFWDKVSTGGIMSFDEVLDGLILHNQHLSLRLPDNRLLPVDLSVSEGKLLKILNLFAVFLKTKEGQVYWLISTSLSFITAILEFSTPLRVWLYTNINVLFCSIMHSICDLLLGHGGDKYIL